MRTNRPVTRPLPPRAWAILAAGLVASLARLAITQPAAPTEPATEVTPKPSNSPASEAPENTSEQAASEPVQPSEPEAPPQPSKPTTAEPDERDPSSETLRQEISELRAELESLRETAEPVEASFEPSVRLYGFLETGFRRYFTPEDNPLIAAWDPASTFDLGGVNIYVDANPAQDLRVLAELRFGLWPDYAKTPDSFDGESTEFYDSQGNLNTWSSLVIERAHADWTPYDALNVRVGYFLTPYGIWNVDHGAPTLIPARVPRFMANQTWPSRQLGIETFGATLSGPWEFRYHAWVSNGRTQGFDATDDKMVGGRLRLAHEGKGSLVAIGASGFYGKNSFAERNITSVSPFTTTFDIVEAYREYGAATDLTVDWNALHLRAEYVMARQEYDDEKRRAIGPGVFRPDQTRSGAYGLVSYELPWLGLQPFAYVERSTPGQNGKSTNLSGGVNIRLSAPARLKGQYSQVLFDEPYEKLNFSVVDIQFSVAF